MSNWLLVYRDCGVMDDDGDLEIVGRMTAAERIKICGDVVYIPPIENALREHPQIQACSVSLVTRRVIYAARDIIVYYCFNRFSLIGCRLWAYLTLRRDTKWSIA